VSLAAPARAEPRGRTLADRFLSSVPLLAIFFWVGAVYAWEAWRHGTPWLFGDELEYTQLSRAIEATGHAARNGQPHSFDSLYTYYIAPAWIINEVRHAYSAVKYMDVVAMVATVFPTYGLARFVVGPRAALFTAAGAVLVPSMMFSSLIAPETVAYPWAALCFFLIAGALLRRTRWWIAGAIVASLLAPLVRRELLAVPAAFILASLFLLWRSPQVDRWRARWSWQDWAGFGVLVVGAGVLLSAVAGHRSHEWLVATGFYKHRMFTYGLWAAGAVVIEVGVLPAVAALALLWRTPAEVYRRELRVFRCVLLAGLITFGWYTAVKGSYQSTVFGTYVVERNLIYVIPLLFVATAVWLERRNLHPIAAVVAALAALYLVLTTPYQLQFHLYAQAPGFALLEWLNRSSLGLTTNGAKLLLGVMVAVSLAVVLIPRFLSKAALPLGLAAAAFVLVWGGGGALAAAGASNSLSDSLLSNFRGDPSWIDDATRGAPAFYLGQQILDPNGVWLLEFWNRSLKGVWSLDGTAPGPGAGPTPDLRKTDGALDPDPHYPYVVTDKGIEVVGRRVATHQHFAAGSLQPWTLYRIAEPLRLRGAAVGIESDGWTGPDDSSYTRYSTRGGRAGTMRILVSRAAWSGPNVPGHVTIKMGRLTIGADKQPHLGKITAVRRWTVNRTQSRVFVIRAPGPRFRVEVTIDPKFVPAKLEPGRTSDRRELGAQVGYTFVEPRHTRR
jgi:glycopeptide antibiotics resistance protein